jgi:AcrR family transcriptional regulator
MPAESARKTAWAPRDKALAARRQEEILEAAGKFFAEHGYAGADLQLLADQLGIGKGTLYRYFCSKEELFLAAIDRGLMELRAYVHAHQTQSDDCFEDIYNDIRAFLAFFDANPHYVELLIQERAEFRDQRKPTYMKYREAGWEERQKLAARLMSEGRVRKMDLKRIGNKLNNMLYGTLFTNSFMRGNTSYEEQADAIIEIIFCGILSDAERQRFFEKQQKRRQTAD